MTLELPHPVAAYFLADRGKGETVADCFMENAVVKDEGRTYHGQAAIRKWRADVAAKFQYTVDPSACEQKDGKCVVTCGLAGNFPGSPVTLRFFFGLKADKIASLEVIP